MTTFAQPDAGIAPEGQSTVAAQITDLVKRTAEHAPRSLQINVGPSEIGMSCRRRLAYRILDWPRTNTDTDPWASIVGTAVHAWLAEAFTADNIRLGAGAARWAVECRLEIRTGITGSCDLYDVIDRRVIDHKVLGETSLRTLKREGPSEQYRIQLHLYGLGWENLGLTPTKVALAAYPRGGFLGGLHVWSEPYDRDVALTALAGYDELVITLDVLDVEHKPELFSAIPASPGHSCMFCPFFNARAKDPSQGCRGHLA